MQCQGEPGMVEKPDLIWKEEMSEGEPHFLYHPTLSVLMQFLTS